mmetsp:Transcript_37157/g.105690  ORF Transcript_37157/g.105690 Transcript_37157/m.105690 type:complete len:298 (-) Transcript_37157:340-1233(-)
MGLPGCPLPPLRLIAQDDGSACPGLPCVRGRHPRGDHAVYDTLKEVEPHAVGLLLALHRQRAHRPEILEGRGALEHPLLGVKGAGSEGRSVRRLYRCAILVEPLGDTRRHAREHAQHHVEAGLAHGVGDAQKRGGCHATCRCVAGEGKAGRHIYGEGEVLLATAHFLLPLALLLALRVSLMLAILPTEGDISRHLRDAIGVALSPRGGVAFRDMVAARSALDLVATDLPRVLLALLALLLVVRLLHQRWKLYVPASDDLRQRASDRIPEPLIGVTLALQGGVELRDAVEDHPAIVVV